MYNENNNNMIHKLLTIVIPTYNMERYLDRCLTSVIVDNASMSLVEVLVIIDGSKDKSSEIAHVYQEKYPCMFRVIDKENGNYGSCINRGLREATGKYIKILDADDWFETNSFSLYLNKLRSTDADAIINDRTIVDEYGNKSEHLTYENILKPDTVYSFEKIIKYGFERNQMHCIAYKTNMLKKIGYVQTEGISYTDQEWIFRPFVAVSTVVYFHLDLYQYLVGREGQTMALSVISKKFVELQTVVFSLLSQYEKENWDSDQKKYLVNFLRQLITSIYSDGLISNTYDDKEMRAFDSMFKKKYHTMYMDSFSWFTQQKNLGYIATWRKYSKNVMYIKHPQIGFLNFKTLVCKLIFN